MYRKILNGQESVKQFASWLSANCGRFSESDPFQVEITPYKRSTTSAQRKLMWGWFYKNLSDAMTEAGICVRDDQGREYPYSTELLHEMFKNMFLIKTEITRRGHTRRLYWSLMDLRKSGVDNIRPSFSEYLDKVKNYAREYHNIDLADPLDEYWSSYFDEVLK